MTDRFQAAPTATWPSSLLILIRIAIHPRPSEDPPSEDPTRPPLTIVRALGVPDETHPGYRQSARLSVYISVDPTPL
ncbi:hypothetical protein GCM10023171_21260 [Microbacterium panaciterrae]|uniref:Uncharacterized protein n=1 Tax=Microbacterium panaciterrae TaxID=985759 RepID=A0ABP8PE09_9MICO